MATNLLDAGLHQYIDRRRGRAKAVGGADSSGSVGSAGAGAGVGAGAGRLETKASVREYHSEGWSGVGGTEWSLLSAGSTIFFVDDLHQKQGTCSAPHLARCFTSLRTVLTENRDCLGNNCRELWLRQNLPILSLTHSRLNRSQSVSQRARPA